MHRLGEIQTRFRTALVTGDRAAVAPLLVGGASREQRLAIHQRHYTASLTRALAERFPATGWLVGSDLVIHAARSFIRLHPPSKPCIAEYGEGFPRHLGAQPGTEAVPYLSQFAELEWHMGRLALATDDVSNVAYLHLGWSLDELIAVYLSGDAPGWFSLRREDVWLSVTGLRGELRIRRITEDEYAGSMA